MKSSSFPDFCCRVPEVVADAERFLAHTSTLHGLIQRGGEVLNVVIQDEFTHDVIARLPGASLVVFDST